MKLSLLLGVLFSVHAAIGSLPSSGQQWPSTTRRVHGADGACPAPEFPCISVQTVPTPILHPGYALIKVSGSAINHDDLTMWKRLRNNTLGLEASGTVVQSGESCVRLRKGDRVWSTFPMDFGTGGDKNITHQYGSGGMTEYGVVDCAFAGVAPSSIDLVAAGTFPLNALTSLGVYKAAGAPWSSKDFTVLIVSGTGGTGYSGIQLAKLLGATTVVTAAGHDQGVSFVKSLGADIAVDYHKGSVFDAVANRSVDLVFDNLGVAADIQRAMAKLKSPGGVFATIVPATANGTSHPPPGVLQMYFDLWSPDERTRTADRLDWLTDVIDAGKLKVFVNRTYDFDHIKDAYRQFTAGGILSRIGVVPKLQDEEKGSLLNLI